MSKKKYSRKEVYEKYNGHCAYCGKEIAFNEMQVDHIKPLQRGCVYNPDNVGTDVLENCNPSCRQCNYKKSILTIEQFRESLIRQCERLMETFSARQSVDYGLIKVDIKPIKFYFELCDGNVQSS